MMFPKKVRINLFSFLALSLIVGGMSTALWAQQTAAGTPPATTGSTPTTPANSGTSGHRSNTSSNTSVFSGKGGLPATTGFIKNTGTLFPPQTSGTTPSSSPNNNTSSGK